MYNKSIALFVVSIALLGFVSASYTYNGNISQNAVINSDGMFDFRQTVWVSLPTSFAAGFRSVSVHVQSTQVSIDTLGGFISYANFLTALVSYWQSDTVIDPNNFDASGAAGVMAQAFISLSEKDSEGNVLHTYPLSTTATLTNWNATTGSDGSLHWIELTQTFIDFNTTDSFKVTSTWFVSDIMGQINLGNTPITPRVVESVLRIDNYPYKSPQNTLSLKIASASAASDITVKGSVIAVAESNPTARVYVGLSGSVMLADYEGNFTGSVQAVTIGTWKRDSTIIARGYFSTIAAALATKFSTSWAVHVNDVTFPAAAKHIIYDPTLGTGRSGSSDATGLVPSIFMIVLVVIAAFHF